MTKKSLYITDLDGTLLNSDKELSKYTIDTINALIEKGIYFSVATARTTVSALKILADLNINLPVVFMNGVVIYDIREEKYIKIEEISEHSTNAIIHILNRHKISGFMYGISEEKLTTYYESIDTKALQEFHDERVHKYNKSFVQVDSFLNKAMGNKIIYFALIDQYERLAPVLDSLKTLQDIDAVLYRDIYADDQWYLEIHSKNASKYNAVKFIRENYKFDKIIGFGDNHNDLPLFQACDECYAVSNAVAELKERATGIIAECNSDGVARFIVEREM
jgi:5-amino-6-(5-phospho-D-ribitylamino)uracil phosphatase